MKLWKAIKAISKDETKIFVRAKNFPCVELKLYYYGGTVGGGIRMVNDAGDPVSTFPVYIMDGWEESI